MAQNLTREDFIRILAERARFTIKDTRVLWETVEEIFRDCISEEIDLDIRGFGHLYIQTIPARIGHDPRNDVPVEYPEAKRVIFQLSHNLRDIHRKPKRRKCQNSKATKKAIEEENQSS